MSAHIHVCGECGTYTLREECPSCHTRTLSPHPPRFSPEDKYGKYRRQLIAMSKGGE